MMNIINGSDLAIKASTAGLTSPYATATTITSNSNIRTYRSLADELEDWREKLCEERVNWEALEEVTKNEGFEIESQQTNLSELEKLPHEGWLFLREKSVLGLKFGKNKSRVTILRGNEALDDIQVAIVEKPGEISMFLSPESQGTIWDFEEMREILYNILSNLSEKIVIIPEEFTPPYGIKGIESTSIPFDYITNIKDNWSNIGDNLLMQSQIKCSL